MGTIQLTVSLAMIALFAIALISFGTNFAADNNAPVSIADDPEIINLYSQSGGNLSGFESGSEGQYESIVETTTGEGGTAPTSGPFTATSPSVLEVAKSVIKTGYIKIFGSGSGFGIFMSVFVGIILFMIGLYIYKTLRGLPD